MNNKLTTINVLELWGGCVDKITAYEVSPEGEKAAKKHFVSLLRKYRCDDDEIQDCLNEGHYERDGKEEFLLVYSDIDEKE